MPGHQPIQSLQRGIRVLKAVTGVEDGLSAEKIARAVGVKRSAIYRLLQTLEAEGMLVRREHPVRFMIGPGVAALDHMDRQRHLLSVAADVLHRAHARFLRSSMFLVEFTGCAGQTRLAYRQNSAKGDQWFGWGTNTQPYMKASSLLLLAYADEALAAEYYRRYPFVPEGREMWGTRTKLELALKRFRRQTRVELVSDDPYPRFLTASPVLKPNGQLIAAVAASIPLEHGEPQQKRLTSLCQKAAAAISQRTA